MGDSEMISELFALLILFPEVANIYDIFWGIYSGCPLCAHKSDIEHGWHAKEADERVHDLCAKAAAASVGCEPDDENW